MSSVFLLKGYFDFTNFLARVWGPLKCGPLFGRTCSNIS